ncbi:TonB-dependent receptor [Alteromonas gracilis]|uniref:TonB-dependent receptor n=1 Tax=Alteromonas gracilis TaxID=1479524 RepID=A0ABX5CL83_9ALTE|nr:TonB-dependent receptor [Alteromonas gracilis]PRO68200.1 TonB-dependent receptor [Alteromonas gracilis]
MSKRLPARFNLNRTTTLIALCLGLHCHAAMSQETNEQAEDELYEQILITASKRSTGLQETPIAVSVTSGEAIEQTQVLDIQDLQALVPTLRVNPLQRSANTNFSIRGFGNGANNTGIEPSVGVFIDGVYRSRAAAQIGDLPRVQQVEVLSGPQSTLFGKNASAGVISVRTQGPSFTEEGKLTLGVGNYDQRLLKGYYTNGITDEFAFSLSGGVNKRDGYTESVVDGVDTLNNRDRWNIRGQALYEPSTDVKFRFIADYSEIDERCCTVADVINGPTTAVVRALGGTVLDTDDPFAFKSALNFNPSNTVEDGGVSLQIDVDFDTFALTSITAYRNNKSDYFADVDYTSLDILSEEGHTEIDTFTQELRLTSLGENTLDWMFGMFYFSEEVDTGDTLFYGQNIRSYFDVLLNSGVEQALASLPTPLPFDAVFPDGFLGAFEPLYGQAPGTFFNENQFVNSEFLQKNDALSVFFNLDYHISDRLTTTVGVSYTEDEKDVSVEQNNNEVLSSIDIINDPTVFGVPLSTAVPALAGFIPTLQGVQFLPPQLVFPNTVEDGNTNDDKVTWSARIAYEINQNFNVFATAATGFKASSWNLSRDTRPFGSDQSALESVNLARVNQTYGTRYAGPEESTVYELGVKARFKRGAFNVTLFDQTIEGFQSSTFVGTGYVLANAGKQSTQGLEFDSTLDVTENLVFSFAGTILDPVYDSFVGANGVNGPIDLSGTQPAGIHERSFVAGLTYHLEFENGTTGFIRSDYLHESETQLVENVPPELTREVNMLNASAGLTFTNGISVQLWVRNLNNDEYYLSAFPPPIQAGSFNAYPSQPRTFGATVSYMFD